MSRGAAALRRGAVLPAVLLAAALLIAAGQGRPPAPAGPRAAPDTVRQVQIVRADSLTGNLGAAEPVRALIGNVHLRQDSTELFAGRAVQYLARNQIAFTGAVRIVQGTDTLRADSVFYDGNTKVGRATGRVRLTDGSVRVVAPTGTYFADEKRAAFTEGVTLVDSATTLSARQGVYWSDDKRADFYGAVRLHEGDRTYLEADTVTYFRDTEVADARGGVFIERLGGEDADAPPDTLQRTLLFGERAYNDNRAGLSRVEGRPLLVQLQADSAGIDTLVVRARRLEALRLDSLRRLVAVDSVRLWRSDLAAVADSAVYDRVEQAGQRREQSRLFGRPMAWFETTQVTGDSLLLEGRGGGVDSLVAAPNAFVVRQDTLLDRLQQLRGGRLVAVFEADSLRRLHVAPNAEAIYHLRDEAGAYQGAVQTSGSRMTFFFRDDAVARIEVLEGIEGVQYPPALVPDPFTLDGFRWEPALRPRRAALLEGRVLPPRRLAAPLPPTP